MPEIKGVTRSVVFSNRSSTYRSNGCRFPAHEHISGASKIPTVIYYDLSGRVRAVGAEAMKEGIYEIAEEENWVKAEWYTSHNIMPNYYISFIIPKVQTTP